MPITAEVVNGKVTSEYTDKSKKEQLGSKLGYDQFLQLLCAEMQYQDPLEPTSNTDYVAQMATFSQLEATLGMQDSMKDSLVSDQTALASSLVGKKVIVADEKSATGFTSGVVDYVMYKDGKVMLSIDDKLFDLGALDTVANEEYFDAVVATQTFKGMLNELPTTKEIDLSYKQAVQQVRKAYNELTDYQKGFVAEEDLNKLKALEKRIEELEKAEEAKKNENGKNAEEDKAAETTM